MIRETSDHPRRATLDRGRAARRAGDGAATRTGGGAAPSRMARLTWTVGAAIFWSWNVLLGTFALFGLVPLFAAAVARDAGLGLMPWSFVAALALLVATPLASLLWGWRLRRDVRALVAFFYGVEMPLLVLGVLRFFVLQQLTVQVSVWLGLLGAGVLAFAASRALPLPAGRSWTWPLRAAALAVLVVTMTVWLALIALYAVPVAAVLAGEVFSFRWVVALAQPLALLAGLVATALALYTASLVAVLPVAAAALYGHELARVVRAYAARHGRSRAAAALLAGAAVVGATLAGTASQPQERALATLAQTPRTAEERHQRLSEVEALREGLVNAYLAPYRYLGATGTTGHLPELWQRAFGGTTETYAPLIDVHDVLAQPFLYRGAGLHADRQEAERLYAELFDEPLQEAERVLIDEALGSTFDRERVEATLLDRDAEHVWLAEQDLHVTPRGDWAEIELHETYVNRTAQDREVLYHFALPESAALTGVWLGESADKARAHAFAVAPRGAAQRVYREEVQRRVDPALLEQVGPRQYRLRVFPILAAGVEHDAPRTHLWLRLAVMARDGAYPLPELIERRNLFFTRDTLRTRHDAGDLHATRLPSDDERWLPRGVVAGGAPRPHVAVLSGYTVRATPDDAPPPPLPRQSILVVVDRSRSMHVRAAELAAAMERLRMLAAEHDVEVALTSASSRGEPARLADLTAADVSAYGGQGLSEQLEQAAQLTRGRRFDLVLVLTDDGGARLETDREQAPDGPLWVVHLGSEVPAGYADVVADRLSRAGSGVAASVDEVLARRAWSRRDVSLVDGYRWTVSPNGDPTVSPDPDFAPLAARQLLRVLAARAQDGAPLTRDELHRIAIEHGVVTPLSSMIVLVNDAQREALRAASASDGRFERATESGELPSAPWVVTGVPEPAPLVLVAFAVALLWLSSRPRGARARS